ncbi:hypothetical protein CEXT_747761 [Caerostris extrusa]|uniref:Uncharacterized protein n=1 Tax=Caerostris extrusa TaxID=172846 RepID=A0AAV4T3H0_CAEEX|nr:hypothetical protein CEXT_747761 [Caerostris extrusa]
MMDSYTFSKKEFKPRNILVVSHLDRSPAFLARIRKKIYSKNSVLQHHFCCVRQFLYLFSDTAIHKNYWEDLYTLGEHELILNMCFKIYSCFRITDNTKLNSSGGRGYPWNCPVNFLGLKHVKHVGTI